MKISWVVKISKTGLFVIWVIVMLVLMSGTVFESSRRGLTK